MNAWVEQFVASSGDLKKRHLLEFKKILGDQLGVAEGQLRASETQLERFRVSTITLPSGGTGAQATSDPSIAGYFQQKGTLGEVQSERIALEQMVANAKGGPLNPQAFLMLPSILNNTPQLRAAIEELSSRQAALRTEQQFLTDANPRIKQLSETVRALQYETIPPDRSERYPDTPDARAEPERTPGDAVAGTASDTRAHDRGGAPRQASRGQRESL